MRFINSIYKTVTSTLERNVLSRDPAHVVDFSLTYSENDMEWNSFSIFSNVSSFILALHKSCKERRRTCQAKKNGCCSLCRGNLGSPTLRQLTFHRFLIQQLFSIKPTPATTISAGTIVAQITSSIFYLFGCFVFSFPLSLFPLRVFLSSLPLLPLLRLSIRTHSNVFAIREVKSPPVHKHARVLARKIELSRLMKQRLERERERERESVT